MQPPKELSVVYYNARSLLPKFDELCVLVESYQPDIICITETWLCTDVLDNEISIPGYNTYRQDRNRHGGGILMYTRCELAVSVIPNMSPSLEFLPVSIRFSNFKFCICVFYRPPSSHSSIFDTFFESLEKLNISQFCNFLCIGDFNVDFNDQSHRFYSKLCCILESFGLSQVVSGYTHASPLNHTSLIDLAIVSSPSRVRFWSIIPPLANSDHLGIHIGLDFRLSALHTTSSKSRCRTVWRYAHADFVLAQQLISETDWDRIITNDVDSSWLNWQTKFLEIMEVCIPKKVLSSKNHSHPWLTKSIVQAMRRRNALFKQAMRSRTVSDYAKYRKARNKVVSSLRSAKEAFFHELKPSNSKKFWKTVKCLNNNSSSIPTLTHDDVTHETDQDKALPYTACLEGCNCYAYS